MSAVAVQAGPKLRFWDKVKPQPIVAFGLLGVALVFGGGTRPGLPSDFLIRIVSWPVLLITGPLFFIRPELRAGRSHALAALALLLIPLTQLTPLPSWLWSSLPGRAILANALHDAGLPLGWRPMTMQVAGTTGALASLAAPIAVCLLVLQLTLKERRLLVLGLIAFGVASVVLGFLQISQGESSPLRFYAITNPSQAVGFFANRNHFAALLYMLIPLVAAWILATAMKIRPSGQDELDGAKVLFLALLVATFAILLLAQGMASSRAGLGLAGLATLASFALMIPLRHQQSRLRSARYLVAGVAIGVILIADFALVRIFQRTDIDQIDPYRLQFTQETWQAAKAFFPFGSGMGTFVPVYFSIEKPLSVTADFVNRAHDDLVETWLEAGLLAPAVLIAFLTWWVVRLTRIWRKPLQSGRVTDGLLMRAASISLILPIIHSAFDYPLRTTAMTAVFAVMAGLMVDPVGRFDRETSESKRPNRRRKKRSSKSSAAKAAQATPPAPAEAQSI